MPTILLVEDDDEIRELEAQYLIREKFNVTQCPSGAIALKEFAKKDFDCVVLDLNLPEVDGVSVAKLIREKSGVPIIMVTARVGEIDELIGLDSGADDYLKKPFSPKVLVARVKALLKRPELVRGLSVLKRGDFELNLDTKIAKKGNQELKLTATQFNLLFRLMASAGKVFTREDLIESGYNKDLPPDIFDRTIDSHIKNLRKCIETDPKNPKHLLTIRGHGYKFNP